METNIKPKRQYKPGTIDDCQTPPYALDPLLPYLQMWKGNVYNGDFGIWECASGQGYLYGKMKELGYIVINTDIIYGQDFFTYEPDWWDCIVTNPPFSLKFDWIARCYELGKPWALLLPVETIGTWGAQKHFIAHEPEIGIIYMNKRINFKMPNKGWDSSAQFPTAWYTWKFGFSGNRFFQF